MENASKALIIAGAILISILIIGLGVYFYNMAASTGKKVNLNSQEATAHNGSFTSYFGSNRSYNEVKSLVQEVTNNNITGKTGDDTNYIYLFYASEGGTPELASPSTISKKVKAGKKYWIGTMKDEAPEKEEEETEEPTSYEDPSYYSNAYIRIIVINEGGKAPGETPSGGGGTDE